MEWSDLYRNHGALETLDIGASFDILVTHTYVGWLETQSCAILIDTQTQATSDNRVLSEVLGRTVTDAWRAMGDDTLRVGRPSNSRSQEQEVYNSRYLKLYRSP